MQPYRCPVCGGLGTVPAGFYNAHFERGVLTWSSASTADREPCRSCDKGVLWGPDALRPTPLPLGSDVPPTTWIPTPLTVGGGTLPYRCPTCGGSGNCGHIQVWYGGPWTPNDTTQYVAIT